MTDSFVLPRKLLIFGVALPVAALAGYLLASPTDLDSLAVVGLILATLAVPFVLRWHHEFLLFSWNAALIVFFLPGSPYLWMVMAGISLGLSLLHRILDKDYRLLNVPSVTWSLLALALVVLITAKMTGGAGLRSLGGNVYGGKKYYFIWFAILGYFALSCQRIHLSKAGSYAGMFLLSGLTGALSNLIYIAGPAAWFLYSLFPVDWALGQAFEDFAGSPFATRFSRIGGLAVTGLAAYSFLMLRYGIRGILDWTKPWRLVVFSVIVVVSMLSGFRSILVIYALLFATQFCFEGLIRSRFFPTLSVATVLGFVLLFLFVQKLPLSIQRSLSVLPLPVDTAARYDARASSEWRVKMWEALMPEIPRYFWAGKGYTASATDYYLATESVRRGLSPDYETMILAGNYHNGPLSVIIPFGIWGASAFLAFVVAALRVLYLNYRRGDPALRQINTFLISMFIAKLFAFFLVYGAIDVDIAMFVGLVGLSVSLNGGIAKQSPSSIIASKENKEDEGLLLAAGARKSRVG